ncbi:MAG: hypothetical protein ACLQPH_19850 [Acidimicrobiales bacterium]
MNRRKLTPQAISEACRRYEAGDSLAVVCKAHGVDASTVRRVLDQAGIVIRPRRER